MIAIPRALARQFRAVSRRSLLDKEPRGSWPLVLFQASKDGLVLQACQSEMAVCYHLNGARSPEAIASQSIGELLFDNGPDEIHYEGSKRRVARLIPQNLPDSSKPRLDKKSVVLVTGGGQGLGAECAKAIAKQFGSKLESLGPFVVLASRVGSKQWARACVRDFSVGGCIFCSALLPKWGHLFRSAGCAQLLRRLPCASPHNVSMGSGESGTTGELKSLIE